MERVATGRQMKVLDRLVIDEHGVSSQELMEQAAQAVAREVAALVGRGHRLGGRVSLIRASLGEGEASPQENQEQERLRALVEEKNADPKPWVAVLCGPGNNGGDGIATARLLGQMGIRVRAFLVGERARMTPDARVMEEKLVAAGGELEEFLPQDRGQLVWMSTCACAVDALLGVGLGRNVEGAMLAAVQRLNSLACPVVACDIPTGLDADTGRVLGLGVRATATVTFTCAKQGLFLGAGRAHSGRLVVADIGIPPALCAQVLSQDPCVQVTQKARYVLPRRPRTAHKGDFGKVFVLAGCLGYTGAPVLCARGAVRMGAGLAFLGVPPEIYPIVAVKCDEAMPFPLPQEQEKILARAQSCDVAVIGPGLGRGERVQQLVRCLLGKLDIPVVLDADGINAVAGHIDILDKRSALTVLTPHDGEFQRLTGCSDPMVDRLSAAQSFATAHRCVLVLKGHATITAGPDGCAFINATGNPGMAKGGSGDVLAGMLGALLGQKHLGSANSVERVAIGVCYHGMAGDLSAQRLGEYAMTPSDLLDDLPQVLKEQQERER